VSRKSLSEGRSVSPKYSHVQAPNKVMGIDSKKPTPFARAVLK